MKLCIFGVALVLMLAAGVESDYKEDFRKIDMACRSETHISEDESKAFFKSDMKTAASNALKCYTKCLMVKQGLWTKGAYDSAAALKQIQEMPHLKDRQKELTKVVLDCKDPKGSDECDTAYLVMKCIVEHFPDHMKEELN